MTVKVFAKSSSSALISAQQQNESCSVTDFDLVIPIVTLPQVMQLKMSEHSTCDSNNNIKMGGKIPSLEDSSRSMSPKIVNGHNQDVIMGDSESFNGENPSRAAKKRRLEENFNENQTLATGAVADDEEDEQDCGGDNESVLSVGRDETNFVAEEEPEDKLQRCSSSSSSPPCESPAAAAPPSEKLNLGLSFRNIHNHLTSLKNHSPLESMFSPNSSLWKSSAFQGVMPTAFNGFPGLAAHPHPTAELLHRYDMLRGSLSRQGVGGFMPENHNNHGIMTQRELQDESLKFSIDNILKADFGRRRITDPINKLRKISNSINQSSAIGNLNNNSKIESFSRQSSFSAFDPMSPTTSNSSSPVLRSPPPPPMTPLSTKSTSFPESPRKLFSPMDLTASNGSQSGAKSEERSESRTTATAAGSTKEKTNSGAPMVWPAWVYCTRYSDRPSSGPRARKPKKQPGDKTAAAASNGLSTIGTCPVAASASSSAVAANSSDSSCSTSATSSAAAAANDDKRPRTAFSGPQLARLKTEFNENRYLTEKRRQQLRAELGLHEAQIKIWFQNKRAKIKKTSGQKNPLALQLMAQGLYNHSTIPLTKEEEKLQDLQAQQAAAQAASASSV